jgi:hypothetical protein
MIMPRRSPSSAAVIDEGRTPLAGGIALDTEKHGAYISGRTADAFVPGSTLTRAEAAQMLWGLLTDESKAMYSASSNNFTDVRAGRWYNTAISARASAGVITGYNDGSFRPDNAITRAEFVTLVVQLSGVSAGAATTFRDVPVGAWYYGSAAASYANGWLSGYGDGTFRPANKITRAEAVTLLNNVLGRGCDTDFVSAHSGSVKSFGDMPAGKWFYAPVTEAANGHTYSKSSGHETWTGLR